MNDIGARAVPTIGGYFGEYRQVHKAAWKRVRDGSKDQVFETADRAELMAWRALKEHMFGLLRSSGEKAAAARSEAEKLFGGLVVKNRQILVERK